VKVWMGKKKFYWSLLHILFDNVTVYFYINDVCMKDFFVWIQLLWKTGYHNGSQQVLNLVYENHYSWDDLTIVAHKWLKQGLYIKLL